ncbi:MAG: hypothetical protein ACJ75E_14100, partial [Actinomycetes bacterium]
MPPTLDSVDGCTTGLDRALVRAIGPAVRGGEGLAGRLPAGPSPPWGWVVQAVWTRETDSRSSSAIEVSRI